MKYNKRKSKDEQEKIRKREHDKERSKKFENFKCEVCGKSTRYHHRFCPRHYDEG